VPIGNDFRWGGKLVVIKTGSSAGVTRTTLGRVAAIVYGEETADRWILYEFAPSKFEELSVQSKSRNHDENYRLVRLAQVWEHGRQIRGEA